MQNHRRAISRKRERRDATDASPGSGHEHHSVLEQVWGWLVLTDAVHEQGKPSTQRRKDAKRTIDDMACKELFITLPQPNFFLI
jgi:hypothetical protein